MIKTQNQIKIETSSSSMSDLVFLLLIFFMITSTLISPNAVKLLLLFAGVLYLLGPLEHLGDRLGEHPQQRGGSCYWIEL